MLPADEAPPPPPARGRRALLGTVAALVVLAMLLRLWPASTGSSDPVVAADPGTVTILAGCP